MGISNSYDSLPSAIAVTNGSRSIQWLTPDEGKCCENGASECYHWRACVWGVLSVHGLHMFLRHGLAGGAVCCNCPVQLRR